VSLLVNPAGLVKSFEICRVALFKDVGQLVPPSLWLPLTVIDGVVIFFVGIIIIVRRTATPTTDQCFSMCSGKYGLSLALFLAHGCPLEGGNIG
jgi:hypothetical protein